MKYALFLILTCLIAPVTAQEIQWMTLDEALAAQKKAPKKIFMDVYTDWCGPCKLLDTRTFGNKDVARYISENYYAVKFNAEGEEEINFFDKKFHNPGYDPNKSGRNSTHQFTLFLGITGYPSMVFFTEDGSPIMPLVGFQTPQQLELFLKMIFQDDYLVFSTSDDFENYRKQFIPKFQG